MNGYPWIYWVVVMIVAGAVSTVLIGIGYLLGLKIAARRVATVREEMAQSRICRETYRPTEYAVPMAALPGSQKGRIR